MAKGTFMNLPYNKQGLILRLRAIAGDNDENKWLKNVVKQAADLIETQDRRIIKLESRQNWLIKNQPYILVEPSTSGWTSPMKYRIRYYDDKGSGIKEGPWTKSERAAIDAAIEMEEEFARESAIEEMNRFGRATEDDAFVDGGEIK